MLTANASQMRILEAPRITSVRSSNVGEASPPARRRATRERGVWRWEEATSDPHAALRGQLLPREPSDRAKVGMT